MITLDTTSIDSGTDEIYSVERGSRVEVFLNGESLNRCIYVNVTKGVAICVKRDLSGSAIIVKDSIVYELVFGCLTVKPIKDKSDD